MKGRRSHNFGVNVGIVGCGSISWIYAENLTKLKFVNLVGCADLDAAKSADMANVHGLREFSSAEELCQSSEIDLVLNLTVPKAHFDVAMLAIRSGKHIYNEKPLTLTLEESRIMLAAAREHGVLTGCAPDTVLGAGIQTCRALIDSGEIGQPVGASAFMLCPGHESWHPSPAFYYEIGGGPMLDMGPYYVSALVTLLGPIKSVAGYSRTTHTTRTITSQPLYGTVIPVETPTHILANFEFESGALAHFSASFDVIKSNLPHIEVYGTDGSLMVPDPNMFGGEVKLWRKGASDWESIALRTAHHENWRGIGVAELAWAAQKGQIPRASGEMGAHVLEAMLLTLRSSETRATEAMTPGFTRPAAMPQENLFS